MNGSGCLYEPRTGHGVRLNEKRRIEGERTKEDCREEGRGEGPRSRHKCRRKDEERRQGHHCARLVPLLFTTQDGRPPPSQGSSFPFLEETSFWTVGKGWTLMTTTDGLWGQ